MSELKALFTQAGLSATAIETLYWPESAGRYAGILRRLQIDFPVTQLQDDFRSRLQDIVIPWLEAQEHPEAQCVSVEKVASENAKTDRFVLEIVCR